MHSNTPASNESGDQTQAGPEGASKLHKEVAQMPMLPTPTTWPSCLHLALVASWGVIYDKLTEEEKMQTWFTHGSA